MLLYKDFDKWAALETKPEAVEENEANMESPLLNSRTKEVGISNKPHSKCLNSIQIIYIFTLVNKLYREKKGGEAGGDAGAGAAEASANAMM